MLWRYDLRDGEWSKIPYDAKRPKSKAKADDPSTWATFDEAWNQYNRGGWDGIGYEFASDDPYFGVDVDKCLDQGQLLEWAAPIVETLQPTYGEISPSGTGIKFIARGKLPSEKGTRRPGMGPFGTGALELYDHGRYFALTGDVFGAQSEIADLQGPADALYALAKERSKVKPISSGARTRSPSGPSIERRVIAYINTIDPAVSGQAGHDTAFRATCSVGPGFNLEPDVAFRLLWEHWNPHCVPPWSEAELRHKVDDAYRQELRRGWLIDQKPPSNGRGSSPSANGHAAGNGTPTTHGTAIDGDGPINLTELGNARRLVRAFGDRIRYCHTWKTWLVWDGKRRLKDDTGEVFRLAKKTVRQIAIEGFNTEDEEKRKALLGWAIKSENKRSIEHMVFLAQSESLVAVRPDVWNQNGWLFNVQNGTIDLRAGKLLEHRRDDLITCLAPTRYDPKVKIPLWLKTLDLVFAKNEAVIGFIQRLFGIALTADVSEQILPIFHGSGANGKTTILATMLKMMGEDYAIMAPPGLLLTRGREGHPTERVVLFGKRLVVDMESAEGARLNENLVKLLTGQEVIQARGMRENFWSFAPTHKLILGTNHKPLIRETKNAIWRRVKLTPFGVEIPTTDQIPDMLERLTAEYPGILAWCVQGCLDWQRDGLRVPKEVTDATQDYRDEQDVLADFIADECTVESSLNAKATQLYERYQRWTERNGETPLPQKSFGSALQIVVFSGTQTTVRDIAD